MNRCFDTHSPLASSSMSRNLRAWVPDLGMVGFMRTK